MSSLSKTLSRGLTTTITVLVGFIVLRTALNALGQTSLASKIPS